MLCRVSSSARADDPVNTGLSNKTAMAVFTGCPAIAAAGSNRTGHGTRGTIYENTGRPNHTVQRLRLSSNRATMPVPQLVVAESVPATVYWNGCKRARFLFSRPFKWTRGVRRGDGEARRLTSRPAKNGEEAGGFQRCLASILEFASLRSDRRENRVRPMIKARDPLITSGGQVGQRRVGNPEARRPQSGDVACRYRAPRQ